jgi:hypothetical protein
VKNFTIFCSEKMSEKQMTFFTVNCAGKFEPASQWSQIKQKEKRLKPCINIDKWKRLES